MDVGGALRDAREQRGLSLDQLARVTKIRVTTLQAIETNRREKLPEVIYLRGFVRAYAREVGLDPADTVTEYLDQFEPVADIVEPAGSGTVATNREHTRGARDATDLRETKRRVTRVQWVGLAILVIGVAVYTIAQWPPRAPAPSAPPAKALEIARSASPGGSPTSAATVRVEATTMGSREPTVAGESRGPPAAPRSPRPRSVLAVGDG